MKIIKLVKMSTKISVIMPVYNASKYLAEAIESILNQTFIDFELILLNDKSTDSSLQIIKKYQNLDSRIVVINKEQNIGPALLRNEGFELAKGEFIALMDSDDIAMSTRFEKQIAIFEANPEIGVCGTNYTMFGENIDRKIINLNEFHEEIKLAFLNICCVGNPTALIRKSYLNNIRYNEAMVPIEDYDLWSRLINYTKFYNIQESLLNYRWHETNISHTRTENILQKHDLVRINQLNDLGINNSTPNIGLCLNTIQFYKRQKSDDIITILNFKNKLIDANRIIKKYDIVLFENQLNEVAKKTITKALNYNLTLLKYILKNERVIFRNLAFYEKIKIITKSFFRIKKR